MKRIALLHTVKSVYDTFEGQLRQTLGEEFGELKIHNLLDDFLATDPADTGLFSKTNKRRLYNDLLSCQMTGADLIVVSCSTLTPIVVELRPLFETRIIAIDDAMIADAVARASRIGLLATANSTLEPTRQKILSEAKTQGKTVTVEALVREEAIQNLKAGRVDVHDQMVLEMARQLDRPDTIVLAQASMAHMEEAVQKEVGCPVVSSPRLCFLQVQEALRTQ